MRGRGDGGYVDMRDEWRWGKGGGGRFVCLFEFKVSLSQ